MRTSQGPIGHLDADCFYCSAERVRDEFLDGLPVGVLGNQGACVIAKSNEMKACGVSTGEPVWEAVRKCPEGIFLKRDFRWYEILSRLILAILRDYSTQVEYHSIDDFFFEATPPRGMDHRQYAVLLRDRVKERVGVPVTVGIGRSKTLAKLISEASKPFGARAILGPAEEVELLSSRPVTDVSGIAGRRERRLRPWGIATCAEFARADRRLIRGLLTASGEALWWELRGEPVLPLHPERPLHKVLSRGGSLGEPTTSPVVLWAWLVRNLERLVEELEYHEVRAGRVAVWVGYRDGRSGEGRANVGAPSDRFDLLLDALRPCLRRAWRPRSAAERMHVFAERLSPRVPGQLALFDRDGRGAEAVARLKREVNGNFGRFVLRSAATLPLASIYRDPANEYDIGDIRGKICF